MATRKTLRRAQPLTAMEAGARSRKQAILSPKPPRPSWPVPMRGENGGEPTMSERRCRHRHEPWRAGEHRERRRYRDEREAAGGEAGGGVPPQRQGQHLQPNRPGQGNQGGQVGQIEPGQPPGSPPPGPRPRAGWPRAPRGWAGGALPGRAGRGQRHARPARRGLRLPALRGVPALVQGRLRLHQPGPALRAPAATTSRAPAGRRRTTRSTRRCCASTRSRAWTPTRRATGPASRT